MTNLKLFCKDREYKQKIAPLTERVNLCLYFGKIQKDFFLLKSLIIFSTIIKILEEDQMAYNLIWTFSNEEDLKLVNNFIKEYKLNMEVSDYSIQEKESSSFYVENICLNIKEEVFSLLEDIKEFNKFLILTSKYNEKTDVSPDSLKVYIKNYRKMYKSILVANKIKCSEKEALENETPKRLIEMKEEFLFHAKNDLNLFGASQIIFREVKYLNKLVKGKKTSEVKVYCWWYSTLLKELGESVGIFNISPKLALKEMNKFLVKKRYDVETYHKIKKLIIERHDARMNKDFVSADKIMEELSKYQLDLHDYSKFTYWEAQI